MKKRRNDNLISTIWQLDLFIWAVSELSETYEIDADLIEDDDGYTASLYMNYASYNGYILRFRFGCLKREFYEFYISLLAKVAFENLHMF